MSRSGEDTAKVVRPTARFDRDNAARRLACERDHRLASHPPPHYHLACCIQPDDPAAVLPQIDPSTAIRMVLPSLSANQRSTAGQLV